MNPPTMLRWTAKGDDPPGDLDVNCVKITGHRIDPRVVNAHGGHPERAGYLRLFGSSIVSVADTNNEIPAMARPLLDPSCSTCGSSDNGWPNKSAQTPDRSDHGNAGGGGPLPPDGNRVQMGRLAGRVRFPDVAS
jgi:hypothetical protein